MPVYGRDDTTAGRRTRFQPTLKDRDGPAPAANTSAMRRLH